MMLEVNRIDTFYGPIQGLFGMGLSVGRSEMVSLLGRNGMGKTTTVRSIMGLTPARTGTIVFNGNEIQRAAPYQVAQMGVGLVPEGRQIFPDLTVYENLVATAANRRNGAAPWTVEGVYALFPQLQSRAKLPGRQLSGGEQQMLAIGRALMTNPLLLILDEATEGLAPRIRSAIWRVLKALRETGLSILVIDKNVDALLAICDRHIIIEKGRRVWNGTSAQLCADPNIRKTYLGV